MLDNGGAVVRSDKHSLVSSASYAGAKHHGPTGHNGNACRDRNARADENKNAHRNTARGGVNHGSAGRNRNASGEYPASYAVAIRQVGSQEPNQWFNP